MTTQMAPDLTRGTTAPTYEDAQLMVQLAALAQTASHDRGKAALWRRRDSMTYDEFRATYPPGSEGHTDIVNVLTWHETVATLVNQNLLNRALVYDWLWVAGIWDKCRYVALGQRAETVPQMWANFEALAEGQRAAAT